MPTHPLTGRRRAVDERPTQVEELYDELFDLVWRIERETETNREFLLDRCNRLRQKYNHPRRG